LERPASSSPGQVALKAASQEQKYLFILFCRQDDADTQTVWQTLQTALKKHENRAQSVQVNITDPTEKALVERYGLSRSPMPLVLAFAPNGAITGGFPQKLTDQDVAGAFVSPGMAACLKATQVRKLVLLCVKPTSNSEIPEGVREFTADPDYGPVTEVVTIRGNDAAEASFLQSLEIKPSGTVITALLAPPGSMLGAFEGAVSKQDLVGRLAAAQGPCAGGKCGPGGCGPAK
jgi:hypothetical protein